MRASTLDNSVRPMYAVLAGCATDTGNLGVSALAFSVIDGLALRAPGASFTVLDHGRGLRQLSIDGLAGGAKVSLHGAAFSRRLHRPESLIGARVCQRLGVSAHPMLRLLDGAHLFDISGGDSFTDLYGQKRFETIATIKELAIRAGAGLTLMPQTYGPYSDPSNRRRASEIALASAQAWARDARSFEVLRELVGNAFDPERHRQGVDVAFALPTAEPPGLPDRVLDALDAAPVALNISGLIYNDPAAMRDRYGFKADYREVVHAFVERLLRSADGPVVLVPHVTASGGHPESDPRACEAVLAWASERLPSEAGRLLVAPMFDDPRHAKWLISRSDWFCGTRMHSTIAALSTGVPTAAVSYSPKTLGVFESCGSGDHVADPTVLETGEVVERLWSSFQGRKAAAADLHAALPGVKRIAEEQMDAIAASIGSEPVKPGVTPASAGAG